MNKVLIVTLAVVAAALALTPSANALPTLACTLEDPLACLGL